MTGDEISTLTNTPDVSMYAISLTQLPGSALLDTLARESGGRHFLIANADDLPAVATKLGIELRNTYFLGYQPKKRSQDGKFRQVQVQIVPPKGISRLFATSRAGYYGPLYGFAVILPSEISVTFGDSPRSAAVGRQAFVDWRSGDSRLLVTACRDLTWFF